MKTSGNSAVVDIGGVGKYEVVDWQLNIHNYSAVYGVDFEVALSVPWSSVASSHLVDLINGQSVDIVLPHFILYQSRVMAITECVNSSHFGSVVRLAGTVGQLYQTVMIAPAHGEP